MSVRLSIVVQAEDRRIYALNQLAPSGSWSGWQSLGAPAGQHLTVPTLTSSQDGRLELFAFSTTDPGLWHNWQTARYGGWYGWARVPDPPGVTWTEGNLTVRAGRDGRLELFCVNGTERDAPLSQPANDVWHRWQTRVNGGWSSWRSHGQPPDADQLGLLLAANADGRLDLFSAVATPGSATEQFHPWRLPQSTPNGTWSGWQILTDYPDPHVPYFVRAAGRNADGRLEAFAPGGPSQGVWQAFQTSPGGPWSAWISRGQPAGLVISGVWIAANADGRLELFATANDGVDSDHQQVWHVWQTAPNNGWSAWSSLGSPGGGIGSEGLSLAVTPSDDGRLELFAVASDGNLWHRWQLTAGGWSGWTNRGRPAGQTRVVFPSIHGS